MRIVLDAMGGDHAPGSAVEGAMLAAREYGVEILLTGRQEDLAPELSKQRARPPGITVVHCPEVIDMGERPASAVRQKRDSSVVVGIEIVRSGGADAFVSAGNTGAISAAAILGLGRIEGILRPGLGTVIPALSGPCLLIDVGANIDCKADHLVQYALMGSVYMERVFGVGSPRVGLLNVGEEETKGNPTVQETHRLLKEMPLNFVGNLEGKDIPRGMADVVVCDGFVGNVIIKLSEGIGSALLKIMRDELTATFLSRIAAMVMRPSLRRVFRRMDYAEYGGAPLLGVNGVCIIGHGRSNPQAIKNAIRVASQCAKQGLVDRIVEGLTLRSALLQV